MRTNLGLGLAGLNATSPLVIDIQANIDNLLRRFPGKITFGFISPTEIGRKVVQIWGANRGNIGVVNRTTLQTYLSSHINLGGGQAVYAQRIIEANGKIIGIDTVSHYNRTIGGKKRGKKKTRKHRGIIQNGGSSGKLRKGYKYTGKRLKNGKAEIVKVKKH